MKIQILTLDKQFIVIDSEVPFMLVANPIVSYIQGVPQFPEDGNLRGTDYCNRRAGAWQINAWKLLSKQDFPLRPVFTLALVYDDTDNPLVDVRYSDLNLGEGLAGINGQLVTIDPRDFSPIISSLSEQTSILSNFLSLSGGVPASSDDFFIRSWREENVSVGKIFCSNGIASLNFFGFFHSVRNFDSYFAFRAITDCFFHFIDESFYLLKGSYFFINAHNRVSQTVTQRTFYLYSPRIFLKQGTTTAFNTVLSSFTDTIGFYKSFNYPDSSLSDFLQRFILDSFIGEFKIEQFSGFY